MNSLTIQAGSIFFSGFEQLKEDATIEFRDDGNICIYAGIHNTANPHFFISLKSNNVVETELLDLIQKRYGNQERFDFISFPAGSSDMPVIYVYLSQKRKNFSQFSEKGQLLIAPMGNPTVLTLDGFIKIKDCGEIYISERSVIIAPNPVPSTYMQHYHFSLVKDAILDSRIINAVARLLPKVELINFQWFENAYYSQDIISYTNSEMEWTENFDL